MTWFSNAAGLRLAEDQSRDFVERRGNARQLGISRSARRRFIPGGENLELRALLATAGYDYVLNGFSWPSPVVTWSIAPDGVSWNGGVNDLNAVFNAKFGAGVWETQIARAFATWQADTGLEFIEVNDGNYNFNTSGLSQGDPRFGDIRIGGDTFSDDTTLALTYPPATGLGSSAPTEGGDMSLNTGLNFNIGGTYDLYSVVLHEIGHAIGLAEAPNPAEVMYTQYEGVRTGLQPGDIAGAQSLYGPPTPDSYQSSGAATSLATAANLSATLTGTSQTIGSLALDVSGDSEFFAFTAPSWAGQSLEVTASAADSSMLSPSISLYNSNHQLMAQQAGNPSSWDGTATVSFSGLVPGQTYDIAVNAASGTAFSTGAYALTLAFPQGAPPQASPPSSPGSSGDGLTVTPTPTPFPTPTPTPSPTPTPTPSQGPTNASVASALWLGTITKVVVSGTYLGPTSNSAFYEFRSGRAATEQIAAPGLTIKVLNAKGRLVAIGNSLVSIKLAKGSVETVVVSALDGQAVNGFTLSIGPKTSLASARLARVPAAKTVHKVVAANRTPIAGLDAKLTAGSGVAAKVGSGDNLFKPASMGPLEVVRQTRKHLKP